MCDLMIQLTMPGTHGRAQREVARGLFPAPHAPVHLWGSYTCAVCLLLWHSPATCPLKRLTCFCQSQAHMVLAADHFVCFKNSFCPAPRLKRQVGLAGKGLCVGGFPIMRAIKDSALTAHKTGQKQSSGADSSTGHTSSTPLAQDSMGTDKRQTYTFFSSLPLLGHWLPPLGILHGPVCCHCLHRGEPNRVQGPPWENPG